VHAMHPGWADTPGVTGSIPGFAKVTSTVLRSAEQGADTIVWLAAAAEPARTTGLFWHDRRPRSTQYLPLLHDDPAARARLFETCAQVALAKVGR
jgi:dehydrogenase/reductase SDR family protein 12